MRRALAVLFFATAVVGCASKNPEPAKVPLGQAPAAAPESGDLLSGPVVEHLNASPYVYLRVKTSKGEVWAAVPEATIEDGAVVTVYGPLLMTKFESKALKRTFDEVYFGTLTPAEAAAGVAGGDPHAGTAQAAAPIQVGKVEKATGPDARTVSEVWAQKSSLAGKSVTVRGMVVKYNEAVMGKNWIHIQDGSGDAKVGSHDITVTSLDGTAKGELVTVRGTVRADKDFGSGYFYPIIIEDAKVAKDVRN